MHMLIFKVSLKSLFLPRLLCFRFKLGGKASWSDEALVLMRRKRERRVKERKGRKERREGNKLKEEQKFLTRVQTGLRSFSRNASVLYCSYVLQNIKFSDSIRSAVLV